MTDSEVKIVVKSELSDEGLRQLKQRLVAMSRQLIDLKSKFGNKSEFVKLEKIVKLK